MTPRPVIFLKCPKCGISESWMPARRERRKKDVSTWSMVAPFHSRQFTVAELQSCKWWCSRCDKAVEHTLAPDNGQATANNGQVALPVAGKA